jgi:hypothetical protein
VEIILLYKADGHVLSITTAEGYLLSLFIDNKLPKLVLVDGEVSGPELMENEPTELVLITIALNDILQYWLLGGLLFHQFNNDFMHSDCQ